MFGTVRCTNIPVKTLKDKPLIKSSIGIFKKQAKSSEPSNSSENTQINSEKNPSGNSKPKSKLKKASAQTQARVTEKPLRNFRVAEKLKKKSLQNDGLIEPRTPMATFSLNKPKGTPYYTAVDCSKCRFDKLETALYWLGQIKLAESVGKHFVSVAFFKLAHESNAEV